MWLSGFLQSAGIAGDLNALCETLGVIGLVGLVVAMLTWLTFPSGRETQQGAD